MASTTVPLMLSVIIVSFELLTYHILPKPLQPVPLISHNLLLQCPREDSYYSVVCFRMDSTSLNNTWLWRLPGWWRIRPLWWRMLLTQKPFSVSVAWLVLSGLVFDILRWTKWASTPLVNCRLAPWKQLGIPPLHFLPGSVLSPTQTPIVLELRPSLPDKSVLFPRWLRWIISLIVHDILWLCTPWVSNLLIFLGHIGRWGIVFDHTITSTDMDNVPIWVTKLNFFYIIYYKSKGWHKEFLGRKEFGMRNLHLTDKFTFRGN